MVMLTVVLIDVQYIQNVVFSFEESSNCQNQSWSYSHHLIKKSPQQIFSFPLPFNDIWKTLKNWCVLTTVSFVCKYLDGISSVSTGMNDDYNNRIRQESV